MTPQNVFAFGVEIGRLYYPENELSDIRCRERSSFGSPIVFPQRRNMPMVAALRRLLDREIEVMVVDGEPGVRVIALSWQGVAVGPAAERTIQIHEGNAGLLKALNEIEAALP